MSYRHRRHTGFDNDGKWKVSHPSESVTSRLFSSTSTLFSSPTFLRNTTANPKLPTISVFRFEMYLAST